jgi:hypothetical protein
VLLAQDRGPVLRFKADDQRYLLLHSAHFVPGYPYAVGMPDLRLAVMGWKLLRRDDVFSVGPGTIGIAASLVKRIDDQDAVDLDRFLLLPFVEHQPSAETSHRRRVAPG